jgi:transposase-like protein
MLTSAELECLTPSGRRMAQLIDQQRSSGLTVGEFARRHGINPVRFSWWRGAIRRRIEAMAAQATHSAFAEAVVIHRDQELAEARTKFTVDLCQGFRVEVPGDFDQEELRRLIGVLKSC